ncbi:MAG: NAD(P)-binding domain-containing protein [Proteobacteria bacterium]|nr:NAD(P)-binding domain-containing protein [Pseudomonadota bacterium]
MAEALENRVAKICDVAIVGAGPYGLSLAAHLRARGMDFRVFGKAMDSWGAHMPAGMMLKSDGFVSNLSSPAPRFTLKAYCERNALPYADQGLPIALEAFLSYAQWFRAGQVPDLEQRQVTSIARRGKTFTVSLDDSETFAARSVVIACGISWYSFTPPVFSTLPHDVLSHSYEHRDVTRFKGREVAVVGAGSSAIDLAAALREAGAFPRIVARGKVLEFNRIPDPADESFIRWVQAPASGIGRGWKSYFCAHAPLLFHRLPRPLKDRAIASHLHPAGGFFMREKIEGVVPASLGCTVASAATKDGRAVLTLKTDKGWEETHSFDHVITATGYRPDFRKLPFLDRDLAEYAAPGGGSPEVSDVFETKMPGLYAVGLSAMQSFGPLMRFMVGAEFAAPHLAAHLQKISARVTGRWAA